MQKYLAIFFFYVSCTISYEIIPLPGSRSGFGHSPFWYYKTQSLYFTDYFLTEASLNRYDYKANRFYKAVIVGEKSPTFMIPIKGCANQFGVGIGRSLRVVFWDGISTQAYVIRTAFEVETDSKYSENVFDTAKADPKGRFYAGTFRQSTCSNSTAPSGSLYRYSKKQGVKQVTRNIKVSGGLGLNGKTKRMYFLDSCRNQMKEYKWSSKTGALCNEKVVFDFANGQTVDYAPLSLTMDSEGMAYVAMYNGSSVLKVDPCTKTIVERIDLPVPFINSLTFGGPDLKTLFVTTASIAFGVNFFGTFNDTSPLAGSIFMVKGLCAKGMIPQRLCI